MFRKLCVMARCALCCILLGLCVTSSAQDLCDSDEKSSNQCGNLLYDIKKYTCCDRSVTQGPHLSCCGTTAYNKLDSSCCNNKITAGLSQTVSYCCGPKAYNPLNQICCSGRIQNKTSAHTACCGSGLYDTKKQLCCKNQFVWPKETDNHVCCGNATLNTLKQCCCATDTLKVENLDSACCKQKLERDKIPAGLSQTASYCCGPKTYNPVNEICCSGRIQNKTSAHTKCCGSGSYDTKKQLCCKNQFVWPKETDNHVCCGNATLNTLKQCCCDTDTLKVENLDSACCKQKLERERAALSNASQPANSTYLVEDPRQMAYQGRQIKKNSGVTQCCGEKSYELSEEGVLCCDGQLYRGQPAGSICAGNVPYSPHNCTVCQKHAHLPAGQQCCGKNTFDPHKDICCNGHSHKGKADMTCCGSHAYNASSGTHMCCSGHLHDLMHLKNKEEAECCGPVLLTNKKEQQCCHSAEKTLVYKAQPGHSCCGHWYYSMSLWSCCAGQLIPKPTHGTKRNESKLIRNMSEYSQSDICNKTVLLGTVASVAVKENGRYIVLKDPLEVNATDVTSCGNSLEVGPLDHCLFPALELGRTYLWTKNKQSKYEPLADVNGLTTPLHTILSLCQSSRTCYNA
ncbi:hypothetical protein SRHO_G00079230 [Serrasalmus rhombeus]